MTKKKTTSEPSAKDAEKPKKSQAQQNALAFMWWSREVKRLMNQHYEYSFKEELREWFKEDDNGKRMFNDGATPLECYSAWFKEFFI